MATNITFTRSDLAFMSGLWQTDTASISVLANNQFPNYSGSWSYIYPRNSISQDGDVHINMGMNSTSGGVTGNNVGTSPIVAEPVNVTAQQLSQISGSGGYRASPSGIFRFYTEHLSEKHFEIHPVTNIRNWNGSTYINSVDYLTNIRKVVAGEAHSTATFISLLNSSQTVTATVAPDNLSILFTFPSPSVNYVNYTGALQSNILTDTISSYFVFKPDLVTGVNVKCRLINGTSSYNYLITGVQSGSRVVVNALTRTDVASLKIAADSFLPSSGYVFPRPVEFIVLETLLLSAPIEYETFLDGGKLSGNIPKGSWNLGALIR